MAVESHWWETINNAGGERWINETGASALEFELWLPPAAKVRRVVCDCAVSLQQLLYSNEVADQVTPLVWQFSLKRTMHGPDGAQLGNALTLQEQCAPVAQVAVTVPTDPARLLTLGRIRIDPVNVGRSDGTIGIDEGQPRYRAGLWITGFPATGSWYPRGTFRAAWALRALFDQDTA